MTGGLRYTRTMRPVDIACQEIVFRAPISHTCDMAKPDKKRDAPLLVRFTDDERAVIQRIAKKFGMKEAELIRQCVETIAAVLR